MRSNSTFVYFVNSYKSRLTDCRPIEDVFLQSDTEMPHVDAAPSDKTINNILGFARSYDVMESKNTGFVEMNLN